MSTQLQGRLRTLRTLASHPAFILTTLAAVVLGGANAALLSVIHAYLQPDRVTTGLVAAVDLVRIVITIYLGMPPIC